MTEKDYRRETNIFKLLAPIRNDRKKRLFAIACARRVEYLAPNISKEILDTADKFADGYISAKELKTYWSKLKTPQNYSMTAIKWTCHESADAAAYWASHTAKLAMQSDENEYQLSVFHDIFLNPYQTLPVLCLNKTIISIAQDMYEANYFIHMPILHDALLDNGNDEYFLEHASKKHHFHGCFLVDLILGKT